ncbi:hypothetical protein [Gordonia effusa]|nr:hypothetical protein [Gordonia effusa]
MHQRRAELAIEVLGDPFDWVGLAVGRELTYRNALVGQRESCPKPDAF